jgi:ABC-type nitrate/sulfonate/bicarbonate transport system substrate-binding protein
VVEQKSSSIADRGLDRRQFVARSAAWAATAVAGTGAIEFLAGCGQKEEKSSTRATGLAAAGTTIPSAQLDWAMAPYPGEVRAVVGMRRGYFRDVGITIGPTPTGAKFDLTSSLAPLLSKQVDVGSGVIEVFESQLDHVQNARVFMVLDTYEGYGFFAPPESNAKSLDELMKGGMPFEQAMKPVVQQMLGRRIAVATDPAARLFYDVCFDLGGYDFKDVRRVDVDNPKIVSLALAGRVDFAAPSGGTEFVKLEQAGFKKIVDAQQIIRLTDDVRKLQLVTHSTYLTRDDVYENHYDTILRATSVIYRIIDDFERDPIGTAPDLLPFLNAYTGTALTPPQLEAVFKDVAIARNFDKAAEFFVDRRSPYNIYTVGEAQMATLRKDKVLKHPHQVSEIDGARRVWLDLRRYRDAATELFAEVKGKNPDLEKRARQHFDARNYLDAYRFLASLKS